MRRGENLGKKEALFCRAICRIHIQVSHGSILRIHALHMTRNGGAAHIGSVFSCADILAVLYGGVLNVDPDRPQNPTRDRFILSKGHAGAGLYAVLAERGFFPAEKLETHYQDGSDLSGHVSHRVPGVDLSTGALGHGLSVAAGMAYVARLDRRAHRVFCLLGDGELNEGSTWEAVLFAGHHGLDSMVAIVDYNPRPRYRASLRGS